MKCRYAFTSSPARTRNDSPSQSYSRSTHMKKSGLMRFLVPSLAALLAAPLFAADSYTFDGAHTYPVFEVRHLNFSTQRGRFNKTSGKLVLDLPAKQS